jgi:superfamily I DNA/RNA helicase
MSQDEARVLTGRIAWQLATGRARPGEILAITYEQGGGGDAAGEARVSAQAIWQGGQAQEGQPPPSRVGVG